jgi:hypothetical protein
MDEKLRRLSARTDQIDDDGLADAMDAIDAAAGKYLYDLVW